MPSRVESESPWIEVACQRGRRTGRFYRDGPLSTEERRRVEPANPWTTSHNGNAFVKSIPVNIPLEIFKPPPWMDDALCATFEDRDIWTSSDSNEIAEATEACFRCPVRRDCFLFAWETEADEVPFHVWGGTSASLRKRLHKKYDNGLRAFEQVNEPIKRGRPVNAEQPKDPCGVCGGRHWHRDRTRHGKIRWRCVFCRDKRNREREAA